MPTPIQRYEALRELAPDLWVLDGEWYDMTLKRRMTVVRLKSGELVIHSSIRLRDEDYAGLDRLGRVAYIVAPNCFHHSEAFAYSERYPSAKVYASVAAAKGVAQLGRLDGTLPEDWPQSVHEELPCMRVNGLRILDECLLIHRASRTLITTDLVFNMQADVQGGEKWFFEKNQIYKRFGPSRIFRWLFTDDKSALRQSIRKCLEWDFDRVIMSHGEVVDSGGKGAVAKAFSYLDTK